MTRAPRTHIRRARASEVDRAAPCRPRERRLAALALTGALVLLGTTLAQPLIEDAVGLVEAAATGGSYRLAAGDFVLTETLVIARDLELRGERMNGTAIDVFAAPVGIRVEGGASVRFERMSIGYESEVPGDVVWVHDARLDLVDVRIALGRGGVSDDVARPFGVGSGLVLTGSAHATVTGGGLGRHQLAGAELHDDAVLELIDSELVANGTGVYVGGDARLDVRGTHARGHTRNALLAVDAGHVVVADSTFSENGVLGADLATSWDGVRLGGSVEATFDGVIFVDHPRAALSLFGAAKVRSVGSTFEGNGGLDAAGEIYYSAVLLEGDAHLSMEGDVLRGNTGGALEIAGSAIVDLDGVTIAENGTWSHVFVTEDARLTVRGSRFLDNEGALYGGGSARVEVHTSEINGGDTIGIGVGEGAVLELHGSVVRDHAQYGVAVQGDARATITGTTIETNGSGVVLVGRSWGSLSDNDVHGNVDSGLAFLEGATGDATDNRVDRNGWNGILVGDDARADVTGNLLDGNPERGILFDARATGRVDGNTLRGGAMGIAVWAAATPQIGMNTFVDVVRDVVEDR
ncbi:MAG: right-handed parallel beta-helix repeat-containing protein [Trueperaceae bacterium]